MTDESEELRRELQLARELLEQQENFIAVVAHELRNPIAPVLISLDALLLQLKDRPVDRDTLLTWLRATRRYVDGMRLHLDRLLDFTRFRAGRVDLVLEETDLSLLTGRVLDDMMPMLQAAGCAVRTSFEQPLAGHWDKMRLTQVIWNLVSNAAKYAAGAPIDVTTERRGTDAVLTVTDHGPGIPEQERDLVFRRFERARASGHTGFGVGLWLVLRIVEVMGGTVDLVSKVGHGASFSVTLPRRIP